jgi:hypothetical protein
MGQSWKLGNTAGKGGVVSGYLCMKFGTGKNILFAGIFPSHNLCGSHILPEWQFYYLYTTGGSVRKTLQGKR